MNPLDFELWVAREIQQISVNSNVLSDMTFFADVFQVYFEQGKWDKCYQQNKSSGQIIFLSFFLDSLLI